MTGPCILLVLCFLFEVGIVTGGIVLIVSGVRGKARTDRCICGYSLRGLRPSTTCCPECGRGPSEHARVQRKQNDIKFALGIVCLVFALCLVPPIFLFVFLPSMI